MIANNLQRLNIWEALSNRFDYNEFSDACAKDGVTPQSALEFAQKVGMISCGIVMYPELSIADAYLKFISEHQFTPHLDISQSSTAPLPGDPNTIISSGTGSCCGGGNIV